MQGPRFNPSPLGWGWIPTKFSFFRLISSSQLKLKQNSHNDLNLTLPPESKAFLFIMLYINVGGNRLTITSQKLMGWDAVVEGLPQQEALGPISRGTGVGTVQIKHPKAIFLIGRNNHYPRVFTLRMKTALRRRKRRKQSLLICKDYWCVVFFATF